MIIALVGINRRRTKADEEFRTTVSVEDTGAKVELKQFVGDFLDEDENELHVNDLDGTLNTEIVRTHPKGGYRYEGKTVLEKAIHLEYGLVMKRQNIMVLA